VEDEGEVFPASATRDISQQVARRETARCPHRQKVAAPTTYLMEPIPSAIVVNTDSPAIPLGSRPRHLGILDSSCVGDGPVCQGEVRHRV
jgi:hypothetical protein